MKGSLQSLRWPSQLQINAVLSSSICSCCAPPLLQLPACEESAAICLLSPDNCHWNVSLQTAVTFIAASLAPNAAKKPGRVMPEWLLPLGTAGCSASAWETEGGWSTDSRRGLSSMPSSLKDLLLVLLTGESLEQFLWSSISWVEFQIQACSF